MHVGMDLVQDSDVSLTLTQGALAKHLQPLPTTPKLWAARQQLLSLGDIKLRYVGELC